MAYGSTTLLEDGVGTFHGRSLAIGGRAVLNAASNLTDKLRMAASRRFGCTAEAVSVENGPVWAAGHSASVAEFTGSGHANLHKFGPNRAKLCEAVIPVACNTSIGDNTGRSTGDVASGAAAGPNLHAGGVMMMDVGGGAGRIVIDEIVPAGRPWGRRVQQGEVLRLVDLEGQQAVDFLCFDANEPSDRYSATNTIKVQGNIYLGRGTVLYSDRGNPLLTIVADSCGRHDTIYGCCSEANNFLRYGVRGTPSCYANFCEVLAQFGLGEGSIVANVNFFMSVPVLPDGSAGVADGVSKAGSHVELRAERDTLAVLSNCPQMHNPCNGYNPTPIRATIYRPS